MENSKIKTIDVFVNEIELSEEQEAFELTPEQEQMNQEFMKRLEQMCIDSITGCTCKAQAEFMQRKTQEAITRAQIIGAKNGQLPVDMTPDQDFANNFIFYAIVHTNRGIMTNIVYIIRECKTCHKIELFGSAEALCSNLSISEINAINQGLVEINLNSDDTLDEDDLKHAFGEDVELVDVEE